MKTLCIILLFATVFVGCSTTRSTTGNPPVKVDTLHKSWCCIVDTQHKDSIVIIKIPKRIDSPYIVKVPKPIDSPYTVPVPVIVKVPKPVDSPYKVPVPIYDTTKIPVIVKVPKPVDSPYAVPKPYTVYDTTRIPVTVKVPKPVDSPYAVPKPYTVPVPVDSPYYVAKPIPVDSPYNVPVPKYVDSIVKRTKYIDSVAYNLVAVKFGYMQEGDNGPTIEAILKSSGLNIVRVALMFSQETNKRVIDDYLEHGFNVQINFNYKPTSTPTLFPTDTAMIRRQAELFFKYYSKWKSQIPFIVVENEWDNDRYRDFTKTKIEYYLTELRIVIDVAHKYGFKVADAGLTGTSLARWYYTQLTGAEQLQWKKNYFVGETMPNFKPLMQMISTYIIGVKNIPLDYLNTHWYNMDSVFDGYKSAITQYGKLCGKNQFVNNEFGIRIRDTTSNLYSLWLKTVYELYFSGVIYAIAYSGNDNGDLARKLTPNMLKEMNK